MLPRQNATTVKPYSEYSHIELTPEEEETALNYFRMLKSGKLEEADKKQKREIKIKKAQEPWTYDDLRAAVLNRAKMLPFEFIIDHNNEKVFHLLCLYFSNDKRFEDEVLTYADGQVRKCSFKKGIGLVSRKKGTGKTVLMQLFQQNKFHPFMQIETKDVSSMFQRKGEEAIMVHSEKLFVPSSPTFFYHQHIGICFGDLGYEIQKNHWGTKSDVMLDVISAIYSKNQFAGDFSNFHYTSNLYGAEMEERYDSRVRDRLAEMFNMIILPGESRRV